MSKKRPYRLGKREASVNETKRRIIDAATLEYQENGIEKTSMQAVARRADVAPGTVLYHYPTPEDLADAAIAEWTESLEMPGPDLIDATAPLDERVTALVSSVYEMYERSGWAYRIYQKSPNHPSLERGRQMWEASLGAMLGIVLGEQVADPAVVQVVSVLIDPGFRGTLISRGMSSEAAADAAAKLTMSWLDADR
ncbi:MAG: TetR/AcrR family transcriptional regulator [Acidimicrobiia bacterium]